MLAIASCRLVIDNDFDLWTLKWSSAKNKNIRVAHGTQTGLMKALIQPDWSDGRDMNIRVHICACICMWAWFEMWMWMWISRTVWHLAKCQAYFMLEYGAYASMCHVTHGQCQVSFRFVMGPCLLREEFEFERQTFGRCTVVNSFVKRCAHKICALFTVLADGRLSALGSWPRPRSPLDSALCSLGAWELASNCPGHQGACLAIDSQVQLC